MQIHIQILGSCAYASPHSTLLVSTLAVVGPARGLRKFSIHAPYFTVRLKPWSFEATQKQLFDEAASVWSWPIQSCKACGVRPIWFPTLTLNDHLRLNWESTLKKGYLEAVQRAAFLINSGFIDCKNSRLRVRANHPIIHHIREFPLFPKNSHCDITKWTTCYCAVSLFLLPAWQSP